MTTEARANRPAAHAARLRSIRYDLQDALPKIRAEHLDDEAAAILAMCKSISELIETVERESEDA